MGDPTLKAKVREQMTAAMKGGDKVHLSTLRMLTAAITNRRKEVCTSSRMRVPRGRGKDEATTESIEAFDVAART